MFFGLSIGCGTIIDEATAKFGGSLSREWQPFNAISPAMTVFQDITEFDGLEKPEVRLESLDFAKNVVRLFYVNAFQWGEELASISRNHCARIKFPDDEISGFWRDLKRELISHEQAGGERRRSPEIFEPNTYVEMTWEHAVRNDGPSVMVSNLNQIQADNRHFGIYDRGSVQQSGVRARLGCLRTIAHSSGGSRRFGNGIPHITLLSIRNVSREIDGLAQRVGLNAEYNSLSYQCQKLQYTNPSESARKSSQKYLKFSDQPIWLSLSVG
jgi:hypothetical protein